MSAKRARLFGGIQSRAGYPHLAGRLQVAGIYCRPGKRSRYGVPRGSKRSLWAGRPTKKTASHWLIPGYSLLSNAHKPAIWILKAPGYSGRSIGERDHDGSVRPRPGKTLGRDGLDRSRRGERPRRHNYHRCMPAGHRRRPSGRGSREIGHGSPHGVLCVRPGQRPGISVKSLIRLI